jgi:Zn-dependent protease
VAGITPDGHGQPDQGRDPDQQRGPGRAAGQRRDPRLGLMIARVFGVPVYISPYWFLVAALLVYLYADSLESTVSPERTRYIVSAAFVILLYLSVLVHELGHVAVAKAFRLPVRRVLLHPLGGFSEITKESPSPGQEFLVAAVGPAVSFGLAGIGLGLTSVVGGLPGLLIDQLFRANLLVALFNLLPGLPLDGGRIFRSGIWKVTGRLTMATIVTAWAGRVFAVLLVIVPIALLGGLRSTLESSYWLWFALIAAFMWIYSSQALRAAKVRARLPALQARRLARRAIPIPGNVPLAEAIRRADEAQARALVVVDHDWNPVALVDESAVMSTPAQRRPWIEVGSLARTLSPGMVLSADLVGQELLEAVQRSPASEYLLIEPSGQVYGVLATSDLDHAFARA